MKRRGFTLVELLTVIAITAIMLGLIIIPVIQSFNLTRGAQGFAEAQDKARQLIERVSREIANSSGVRENEGLKGAIGVRIPGRPVNLGGTNGGADEYKLFEYAKLDILKPAEGDPSQFANNGYIDPVTGRVDPTAKAPRGQVVLPTGPGATMVRYWVGLRHPLLDGTDDPDLYNNPYGGQLMAKNGRRDNLYVLYRAEIQPIIRTNNGGFQVNQAFFADADNNLVPDDIDDPWFFVQDAPGQNAAVRAAKALRMRNWLRVASVVTEFARYDMIRPAYKLADPNQNRWDGNVPRLLSLIEFRPTRISDEPASGQTAVRVGEETDNPANLSPDVYKTEFGSWSGALVRVYPAGWSGGSPYVVGRNVSTPTGDRFRIFLYDPGQDTDNDDRNGDNNNIELMDVNTYNEFLSRGAVYAFTRAILDSDSRTAWVGNAAYRAAFIPFLPQPSSGKLLASFPISENGVDDVNGGVRRADNNLPFVACGSQLSVVNDPNPPGNFYDYNNDINRRFNKVWADNPALRPDIHRYIDLRVTPNADGAMSPLDPIDGFPRARIVPGSEIVYGPDQNPGANYGAAVRYTRTTRNPGPNQYRINYADLREPNYTLLGLPNPPATYTPQNFVSAVYQPRFKAGYIQLNSDPNIPLPTGNISVYYRFQFTNTGDSVAVDYDTRRVMTILLTVRNYPQTSLPSPQDVTLKGTATVRNFVR